MSFNKCIIVGHLGRDPEMRYTPSGEAVCNFSIATSEKRKDANGEPQDITTWFKVTVWRRQAELANQYLSKGKQVYVEGRLRQTEYTDRDGNKRTALEVTASDIQFLGSKGDEGAAPSPSQAAVAAQAPPKSNLIPKTQAAAVLASTAVVDEDVPF